MNWYKQAIQQTLNPDEMTGFIIDNGLKNWSGEIDYNEAKQIAHSSDKWTLTAIPLNSFKWEADPNIINPLPPIVLDLGNDYEVLDGKHRIGAAKARGETTIMAYVGKI